MLNVADCAESDAVIPEATELVGAETELVTELPLSPTDIDAVRALTAKLAVCGLSTSGPPDVKVSRVTSNQPAAVPATSNHPAGIPVSSNQPWFAMTNYQL